MARQVTGAARRVADAAEVLRDEKFNARRIELAEAALETLGELGLRTHQPARNRAELGVHARRVPLLFQRQARPDLLLRPPLQGEVRDAI